MGWLAANPAFQAMPPRSMRRAITPPTPDDVLRLIEAADADLATFVLLAATLGARRGELCGLRWDDVELDAGYVDIVRAIVIVDGRCVEARRDPGRPAARLLRVRTLPDADESPDLPPDGWHVDPHSDE